MKRVVAITSQSWNTKNRDFITFWLRTIKRGTFRVSLSFDKLKWTKFPTIYVRINFLSNEPYGDWHISKLGLKNSRLTHLLAQNFKMVHFSCNIIFDKLKWTKFPSISALINILSNEPYGSYHISKFGLRNSRLQYFLAQNFKMMNFSNNYII